MITKTSLKHPKIQKRIKRSIWLATMQAIKTGEKATCYVENRYNERVLEINIMPTGELIVYAKGCGMKNYAKNLLQIIKHKDFYGFIRITRSKTRV